MPGQVGDLPHEAGKLLMWRRPLACVWSFYIFREGGPVVRAVPARGPGQGKDPAGLSWIRARRVEATEHFLK